MQIAVGDCQHSAVFILRFLLLFICVSHVNKSIKSFFVNFGTRRCFSSSTIAVIRPQPQHRRIARRGRRTKILVAKLACCFVFVAKSAQPDSRLGHSYIGTQ